MILHNAQPFYPGCEIQRPESATPFVIKGIGMRRGENAVIYLIFSNGAKPHEKGVTESELHASCGELTKSGRFTKTWFKQNLPGCDKEGGCNFIFIGGFFVRLGLAVYVERGCYVMTANL